MKCTKWNLFTNQDFIFGKHCQSIQHRFKLVAIRAVSDLGFLQICSIFSKSIHDTKPHNQPCSVLQCWTFSIHLSVVSLHSFFHFAYTVKWCRIWRRVTIAASESLHQRRAAAPQPRLRRTRHSAPPSSSPFLQPPTQSMLMRPRPAAFRCTVE